MNDMQLVLRRARSKGGGRSAMQRVIQLTKLRQNTLNTPRRRYTSAKILPSRGASVVMIITAPTTVLVPVLEVQLRLSHVRRCLSNHLPHHLNTPPLRAFSDWMSLEPQTRRAVFGVEPGS